MNGQAPRPAPAIEVDDVWVSGPDGRRICGLSLRVSPAPWLYNLYLYD